MTYYEAALQILRSARRPLTTREITDRALKKRPDHAARQDPTCHHGLDAVRTGPQRCRASKARGSRKGTSATILRTLGTASLCEPIIQPKEISRLSHRLTGLHRTKADGWDIQWALTCGYGYQTRLVTCLPPGRSSDH
jgi:hypothetical protein